MAFAWASLGLALCGAIADVRAGTEMKIFFADFGQEEADDSYSCD
jgi:hypothetical protein